MHKPKEKKKTKQTKKHPQTNRIVNPYLPLLGGLFSPRLSDIFHLALGTSDSERVLLQQGAAGHAVFPLYRRS